MGKANKTLFSNRDIHLRMNFLYQLLHELVSRPGSQEMIRFHAYSLRSIAKRQVLRLHPEVKRSMCKKCFLLLLPGVTATVRHKGKRQPHMTVTCSDCGTMRRFTTNKDYKLWIESPQAFVAVSNRTDTAQKETMPNS